MSNPYDFCTATLVAPDLVLTAKHCAYVGGDPAAGRVMDQDVVRFTLANTNDASKWTDAVRVIQLYLAPTLPPPPNEDRYFMPGLASDVAVYRLATPIAGALPIPIGRDAPGPANTDFVTAGFGRTSHAGADAVSRNIGTLTFALNGGSALEAMFPTLADYVRAVTDIAPGTSTARLQDEYLHEVLARDYEMLFDAPSNSQMCLGDAGAPLLQKDVSGDYRVFGVASGSKTYGNASRCYFGSVYATFGPATLAFLETLTTLWPDEDGGLHPPFDAGWSFDANWSFDVRGPSGVGGAAGVGGFGVGGWSVGSAGGAAAVNDAGLAGGGAGRGEDEGYVVTNTTGCACSLREPESDARSAIWLSALVIAFAVARARAFALRLTCWVARRAGGDASASGGPGRRPPRDRTAGC
jgi:hypothetical protein